MYPFPVAKILKPYHATFLFVLRVRVEKGATFMLLFFAMLFFFEFRVKFFPNKQSLEDYFHRQHILREYFPSSMLKINMCTSRRTQLQQNL